MSGNRPDVSELVIVEDGELVFRFVQPGHINTAAPIGARLQTSALQSNEFTPNEHSYGPSVYVRSRLTNGVADLHEACSKWRAWQLAEIPVGTVLALGVTVRLSPQDCEFPTIRHAHATLIGVTKAIRDQLIRVIEANLLPATKPTE